MLDAVAVTAGAGVDAWTPESGRTFILMGWRLSLDNGGAIEFHDNAVGTVIMQTPLLAAGGIDIAEDIGDGIKGAANDNVLKLDVTVTGAVSGMVWGVEEEV